MILEIDGDIPVFIVNDCIFIKDQLINSVQEFRNRRIGRFVIGDDLLCSSGVITEQRVSHKELGLCGVYTEPLRIRYLEINAVDNAGFTAGKELYAKSVVPVIHAE